ncbi:di-heme enzyme [Candidatus Chloroploca sp. M-50]|uniref:Di-heme enzyme n=1 Tax=Candidatus Chloroploca mongolica TaxID=2528176 RepID=A0ABS4DDJ9_9CHLR|nr:methanobactin export MATE transporter MbnM [Candidatus Chloroploca mongolica]MBP1467524.1 di-heme enzyme [Candidatus Chloroploca mongolica]
MRRTLIAVMLGLLVLAGGCRASAPETTARFGWALPADWPLPEVPAANPLETAKIELGRALFYEERLSGPATVACATCHIQALAFSDGRARAVNATGTLHPRNTQGLGNVAYARTLTWAQPELTTLEQHLARLFAGTAPDEMGVAGQQATILARLRQDGVYQQRFARAFPHDPDAMGWEQIIKALAAFVRTLITADAPYDRYQAGDATALSPAALRGAQRFFGPELGCAQCHGGFNFTGSTRVQGESSGSAPFHNIGLYNLDGTGAYPDGQHGLAEVSGNPTDMGRFRAPSLRNVALTAPYMHDGSVATLEEVMRLYQAGGRHLTEGPYAGDGRQNPYKSSLITGFALTDQERVDLIAFLEALTDEGFVTDPRFSDRVE